MIGLGLIVPLLLVTLAGSLGTPGVATKLSSTTAKAPAKTLGKYQAVLAKAKAAPLVSNMTPLLEVVATYDSSAAKAAAGRTLPKAGQSVDKYKWLLNLDNTGNASMGKDDGSTPNCHPALTNPNGTTKLDSAGNPVPNPNFPDGPGNSQKVGVPPLYGNSVLQVNGKFTVPAPADQACPWQSLHYESASPVISEGTQNDWNTTTRLPVLHADANSPTGFSGLAPGKYLVTVTSDGYQIGGMHFTICPTADDPIACPNAPTDPAAATPETGPNSVVVGLNPYPLPLGTIKARAFADVSPTTGQWQETDPVLAGFQLRLADYDGQVSVDYYGNLLCTEYVANSDGTIRLDRHGNPTPKGTVSSAASSTTYSPTSATDTGLNLHESGYKGLLITASNGAWATIVDNTATAITVSAWNNGSPADGSSFSITSTTGNHELDYVDGVVPGHCHTGADGIVTVPNLAPNRYAVSMSPPQSQQGGQWIQDTTLEGNHDFDTWVMANETGNDTEQVVAGEPLPFVEFGFVPPTNTLTDTTKTGKVTGQLYGANNYVPGLTAIPGTGNTSGYSGLKLDRPIKDGWVALSNMNLGGDGQLVWAGKADVNGNFSIPNVPDGDYSLAFWDFRQDYLMDQVTISISGGQTVDTGVLPMLMWFARISGTVFVDLNGNGRQDPGEPGVPKFTVQNLNRTNNTYEQGQQTADTNDKGFYELTEAYPLGQFTVEQYFNTRLKTTGITYQACNDKGEHTIISPFVDVSYLPIIGQCGRIDIGVQPYDSAHGDNGGIVATVFNDTIRAAYAARQTAQFTHMTGIPDFSMDLFQPVKGAGPGGTAANGYALNADGSYMSSTGTASQQNYVTEHWGPPTNCSPMDANGNLIDLKQQNSTAVPSNGSSIRCTESPLSGVAVGGGSDQFHGIQTVDGNYGLDATDNSACPNGPFTQTPGCFQNQTGDFLVHATSPTDQVLGTNAPLYKVTSENDLNFASGDQWIPQGADVSNVEFGLAADPCAAQTATPHCQVPGVYPENPGTSSPGPDALCAGAAFTVHITNPDTLSVGGSPYEDQQRNLCDTKLFRVQAGQSVAPNFHFHTVNDVPIPGKFSGYIVDDVSASTDRKSTNLGEVSGIPGAPVGVYDWTGSLLYTATSDYNGVFEALMPSTQDTNCLLPAGVCPQVYRFVGNDPGQFPNPNPNYKPAFRTIAANFQTWPGQFLAADVAPSKAVTGLATPGVEFAYPAVCAPAVNAPQLLSVDRPYRRATDGDASHNVTLTITGQGFAQPSTSAPTATLTLGAATKTLTALPGWDDHHFSVSVPPPTAANGTFPAGPYQLTVSNASGLTTTQGLTYHVLGAGYDPPVMLVGPTVGPNAGLRLTSAANANPTYGATQVTTAAASPSLTPTNQYRGDTISSTSAAGTTLATIAGNNAHTLSLFVPTGASSPWSNGVPANGTAFAISGLTFKDSAAIQPSGNPAGTPFLTIQAALERAAGFNYPAFLAQAASNDPTYPRLANAVDRPLIIVYPADPLSSSPTGAASTFTPFGTYYENLIIHSQVKLQGVGPGGVRTDGSSVQGTRIDGAYFWSTNSLPDANGTVETAGTNEPYSAQWLTLAEALVDGPNGNGDGWDGNRNISEGQVIYVVGKTNTYQTGSNVRNAALDGFQVTGGDQKDFPGNLNQAFGVPGTSPSEGGAGDAAAVGSVSIQGGGVFLNAYANHFQISNNLIASNSGTYSGGIRVGTPYANDGAVVDGRGQTNRDIVITNNQILGNGGTNLAGGIGLFSGSDFYQVSHNVLCGNYSLEYGGGISHFGLSATKSRSSAGNNSTYTASTATGSNLGLTGNEFSGGTVNARNDSNQPTSGTIRSNTATVVTLNSGWSNGLPRTNTGFTVAVGGRINNNTILLNSANDEGGGIMVGGELPATASALSPGAGPVSIHDNKLGSNISNDDGGAIRFLMGGVGQMNVVNNFITNNVSAHEGGGIAIDDTPNIVVDKDTIARNVTTATATTSDGSPAPAGISTARNSDLLQKQVPGTPVFSSPVITNSIIWDNRAGSWASAGVSGIGLPGDANLALVWDIGTVDQSGLLSLKNSYIDAGQGYSNPAGSNNIIDPINGSSGLPVNTPFAAEPCAPTGPPYPNCGLAQTGNSPFVTQLDVLQLRTYFRFRPSAILTITQPADALGNYASSYTASNGMGATISGGL